METTLIADKPNTETQISYAVDLTAEEIELILYFFRKTGNRKKARKLIRQIKEKSYPIQTDFKPMTYKDFKTIEKVADFLNVRFFRTQLFKEISKFEVSEKLKNDLFVAREVGYNSEKERSELLISPILKEVCALNEFSFGFSSGKSLNIDPERGLKGECDFVYAESKVGGLTRPPLFLIAEAKKEDMDYAIAQCSAQMVAAKEWNLKQGRTTPFDVVYGAGTTGDMWQFLKLENESIFIDKNLYFINEIEQILGIIQQIVDMYKPKENATNLSV